MKKVYCKNCIHYQNGFWHDECWVLAPFYEKDHNDKHYPNIIYQDYVHKLEEDLLRFNKENNCPYYKKKWWKIFTSNPARHLRR